MAKVYIINDMNHNFDKAEMFGELVKVTTGKVPIFKTEVSLNMIREGLEGFNVEEDYLLLSGPALLCMFAMIVLVGRADYIKVLVFDAKIQDYIVRHVPTKIN